MAKDYIKVHSTAINEPSMTTGNKTISTSNAFRIMSTKKAIDTSGNIKYIKNSLTYPKPHNFFLKVIPLTNNIFFTQPTNSKKTDKAELKFDLKDKDEKKNDNYKR
ncbi:hypothetical protein AGMMS49936_06660 [Endomicrobiia bacterium]|nr:hypothetical protein AGMMS49936_06660 [Endomicrobiia bacterium]